MATSFALVALGSQVARAAEIRWEGAECDAKTEVAADVERSLGHTLGSVETADFEVSAARASGKWQMTLVTVDRQSGERRARKIDGATCQDAAAALAVAITIAVRAAEYRPVEEPPPAAPAQPEPPAPGHEAPGMRDRATEPKKSTVPSAASSGSQRQVRWSMSARSRMRRPGSSQAPASPGSF